ncbi:MAG: hypothetical protein GY710_06380 [Desulfobacteraceae bacterium]|nr:hypothetical protein [Desulfobacteraceae bacterium]
MLVLPESRGETNQSIAIDYERRTTPFTEYIGAKVQESFDWTTVGAAGNYLSTMEDNEPAMTKDEWKQSDSYRKDIEFEDFSETQAQTYAELYDERQYNKSLIERSPTGFRSVMGFGASLMTQFLDPVNYIPFVGIGSKLGVGGKAIVAGAKGYVGRRAAVSAIDAFIGTAITEPFIAHELNKQGENITFNQIALDMIFAPVVGATFGAVGGGLTARKALRQENRLKAGNMMEKSLVDDDLDMAVDVSAQHKRYAKDFNKDLSPEDQISIEDSNYATAKEYPEMKEVAPRKYTTEIDQVKNEVVDSGINADTGHFAKMDEVEALRKEGRLTAEDEALLKEVEVDIDETYNAYKMAADCVMR